MLVHEIDDRLATSPKLEPFSGGPAWADAVICLGPEITQMVLGKLSFLFAITSWVAPINHVEFAGNETKAEATVRKNAFVLNDVTRVITPIVFARYQFANGVKTAKHFAVGKYADVADAIRQLAKVGGHLEFENYERKRSRLEVTEAGGPIDVTLDGTTRKRSLEDTLNLFDAMTTKGVSAVT